MAEPGRSVIVGPMWQAGGRDKQKWHSGDEYEKCMEQRWQFYEGEKVLRVVVPSLFGCIALGTSQVRPFQPIKKVQSTNQPINHINISNVVHAKVSCKCQSMNCGGGV